MSQQHSTPSNTTSTPAIPTSTRKKAKATKQSKSARRKMYLCYICTNNGKHFCLHSIEHLKLFRPVNKGSQKLIEEKCGALFEYSKLKRHLKKHKISWDGESSDYPAHLTYNDITKNLEKDEKRFEVDLVGFPERAYKPEEKYECFCDKGLKLSKYTSKSQSDAKTASKRTNELTSKHS